MFLWCPQVHCWAYDQQVTGELAFVPVAIHWTAACKILSCHSHLMSPFWAPRSHFKGSLCQVLWEDSTCRTCLSPGLPSVTVRWLPGSPHTCEIQSPWSQMQRPQTWKLIGPKMSTTYFFPLYFLFCIDFPFLAQDWSPAKYQFTYRFC